MALKPQSLKKFWPVMVLATALAERAHAPLMDGAHADAGDINPASPAAAVSHPRPEGKKAIKPDMIGPPAPAHIDPEKVAAKLKELEPKKADDASTAWLPDIAMGNFGSDLPDSGPVSLMQSNQGQPLADDGGSSSAGTGSSPDPGFLPGTNYGQSSETVIYGGFVFGLTSAQVISPEVPNNQLTVTSVVPVPEPGTISLLAGAFLLARRRRV